MDILKSLKRMMAKAEREKTGVPVTANSIQDAITFVESSILPHSLERPAIEIHSDHEVAFTWHEGKIGIMNIAFDGKGKASWASYFPDRKVKTDKGHFQVQSGIPDDVKDDIQCITGQE